MSLIRATRPLLGNHTVSVTVEISAHPGDSEKMVAVIKPVPQALATNASAELQQLVAGLALPIKAVGHPDEIEYEIEQAISQAAPRRDEWQRRADIVDSNSESAKKKDNAANEQPSTTASTQQTGSDQQAAESDSAGESADDDLTTL